MPVVDSDAAGNITIKEVSEIVVTEHMKFQSP